MQARGQRSFAAVRFLPGLAALKAGNDTGLVVIEDNHRSQDGQKRSESFKRLKTELTAHSRSGEKVFHNASKRRKRCPETTCGCSDALHSAECLPLG